MSGSTTVRTASPRLSGELWHLAAGAAGVSVVTAAYAGWLHIGNPTVASLSFLLVVLLVSANSSLRVAVAVSVLAVLTLNFFFMPPIGTFHLEDPLNGLALVAFLAVSVVGSRLSVIARERAAMLEERREAERVRQSAALKSALLSSLSHDLRTPLTAIAVASGNLRASPDDDLRRDQLNIIEAEVARLNRLFQNIMDMARIETGAIDAEREWVHPSDIVDAAVQQVSHALQSHPLELDVDAPGSVQVDPRLTSAALAHLLENAGQYSPAGAPVTVSARVDDAGLTVTVRDRGPGIAPGDLQHVFEQFFRGAGAERRLFGTGMGLAITRGLLAAQGGRAWANNHPDGGASFIMLVPAPVRPTASVREDAS